MLRRYFLALLFFALSCDTSEPPSGGEAPPKNLRDYTWSIDSIRYGDRQTRVELESIWGISGSDVWGAAGDAFDVRDCLWHYDGTGWDRATEGTPITQPDGNKVVYAVWGTSSNNVWAVGRKINLGILSAFIMHFDGNTWVDATPSNVQNLRSTLYTIHGINSTDIWIGGYEYALHYDGAQWRTYKVADSMIVHSLTSTENSVYCNIYSPWGGDSLFILSLSDTVFIRRDFAIGWTEKFGGNLWANAARMTSFTDGVISTGFHSDGSLDTTNWAREFTTETTFKNRFVQSSANVLAVGVWNLTYHFNGTDWVRLFIAVPGHTVDPHADFWGVWVGNDQAVVCDVANGIVYRGK